MYETDIKELYLCNASFILVISQIPYYFFTSIHVYYLLKFLFDF